MIKHCTNKALRHFASYTHTHRKPMVLPLHPVHNHPIFQRHSKSLFSTTSNTPSSASPTRQEIQKIFSEASQAIRARDYEKTLSKLQSVLDIPSVAPEFQVNAYLGFANVYREKADTENFIQNLDKARDVINVSQIEDKNILYQLYSLLGDNYADAGRVDDAVTIKEKSIPLYEEKENKDYTTLGMMYFFVGAIAKDKFDMEKAKYNLQKAIDCLLKSGNKRDSELATLYRQLGTVLNTMGDFEQGAAAMKKGREMSEKEVIKIKDAVDEMVKKHGGDHIETAFKYQELGLMLIQLERFQESQEWVEKAYTIALREYGKEDVDVKMLKEQVDYVKQRIKRYQ